MSSQIAIRLANLTKTYETKGKTTLAVRGISLDIPQGSVFGLLGPNGAGKTTTISMICTLVRPTSGTIELFGTDTQADPQRARRELGLVFQDATLDVELTAHDNLRFQAMLYKLDTINDRITEVLTLVGLESNANDIVKTFSGGMKRRLEIARALITEPKIILLDEPTLGLDAKARQEMWQYIQGLIIKKKLTVLLTTHYLEEAERVCDRIAIMEAGAIVADGTPRELIGAVTTDTIELTLKTEPSAPLVKKFRLNKKITSTVVDGKKFTLSVANAATAIGPIIKSLGKLEIERLELKRPTLEDAYLHYTGKKLDETDTGAKKK